MRRNIVYNVLVLLLALGAVSCRVGKAYEQPEVQVPDSFQVTAFADTSSIADLSWKHFFADEHLQRLIQSGISYNHDLLSAFKRMEISQQILRQARALQLPEANLQVTAQINRPADNTLNGISLKNFLGQSHIENYTALASLSWEADVWGRLRGQKEQAVAEYLQSYEAAKAVQTEVIAGIAQGYFNLLMLDQQLHIAQKNLALNDSFLTATRLLMRAGITNALAVQQAEVQRQSTALLVPQLEQQIRIQENRLQQLTGQLPGRIIRSGSLETLAFPGSISAGLPTALVSRRPDVRASEMALVAAHAEMGVALANMYPALNLTAGAGLEAFKASNWFSVPGSLFGLAAGTVVQPLFRRRALRTQYQTAQLRRDDAVIRFRQSVLQAVTEVSNALVDIEQTRQQEGIARAQVTVLDSAISNAQLLFKSDMATYLEVITAQSNALQAQLNLVSLHRQRWSALVELYRALGGGWK